MANYEDDLEELGFDELLKLADSGNAPAQYELGWRYYNGVGVEQDVEKALSRYEQAANQGYLRAQKKLGFYYYRLGSSNGRRHIKEDYNNSLYWYAKAAEQGDAEAAEQVNKIHRIIELRDEYDREHGLDIDLNEELKAAELGSVDAQMKVARFYINALEGNRDCKKAAYWYGKAAEQGNAKAQYEYASLCEHGLADETNCIEKALYWYEQSADNGYAKAQYYLGLCYQTGKIVYPDLKKSFYRYEQAAKQGHVIAQKRLAFYYTNGEAVEQDYVKTAYWHNQAANGGDMESQYLLGICYEDGIGVEQDIEKAAYWYEQAAKQGEERAQFNLAVCYEEGSGVKKDLKKAVQWYRKAAKNEHKLAQYNLAVCLEQGTGVKKDLEKAVYWYRQAAEQGDEDAEKALERLKKN